MNQETPVENLPPIISDMLAAVNDRTSSRNHRENVAMMLRAIGDKCSAAADKFFDERGTTETVRRARAGRPGRSPISRT